MITLRCRRSHLAFKKVQTDYISYSSLTGLWLRCPSFVKWTSAKFENKTADELMNDPDYEQFIKGGLDNPPPNGESTREVINRCYEALNIIISDMMYEGLTNVAVCTHGGLIMNMLAGFGVPKRKTYGLCLRFRRGL